jgi:hypothetical protein
MKPEINQCVSLSKNAARSAGHQVWCGGTSKPGIQATQTDALSAREYNFLCNWAATECLLQTYESKFLLSVDVNLFVHVPGKNSPMPAITAEVHSEEPSRRIPRLQDPVLVP